MPILLILFAFLFNAPPVWAVDDIGFQRQPARMDSSSGFVTDARIRPDSREGALSLSSDADPVDLLFHVENISWVDEHKGLIEIDMVLENKNSGLPSTILQNVYPTVGKIISSEEILKDNGDNPVANRKIRFKMGLQSNMDWKAYPKEELLLPLSFAMKNPVDSTFSNFANQIQSKSFFTKIQEPVEQSLVAVAALDETKKSFKMGEINVENGFSAEQSGWVRSTSGSGTSSSAHVVIKMNRVAGSANVMRGLIWGLSIAIVWLSFFIRQKKMVERLALSITGALLSSVPTILVILDYPGVWKQMETLLTLQALVSIMAWIGIVFHVIISILMMRDRQDRAENLDKVTLVFYPLVFGSVLLTLPA